MQKFRPDDIFITAVLCATIFALFMALKWIVFG